MSLEKDYINIIMTLLHMYLDLINGKRPSKDNRDNFTKVASFLMNIEQKGSSVKRT